MPVTDEQLQTIFRYFDGELNAEEEEQLMQQLQQDKDLQAAFDQQVLMSRFAQNEKAISPGMALEPADDFLQRVTGSEQVKTETQPNIIPIKKTNYRWLAAAAAIFIFLLVGVLYYQNQKKGNNPVVKKPEKDTAALVQTPAPSLPDSNKLLADNDVYEKLYKTYYEPLPKNTLTVPAAAQAYQYMYDRQQYKQLAAEKESSLGTKGQSSPVEDNTVLLYFRFYKALAALQTGKPEEAEIGLKKVMASGLSNAQLLHQADWYLLMIYLKQDDKENSLLQAHKLSLDKKHPHHQQAVGIEKLLNR